MNTQQVVLTRCALCSADREPHRRNWTLPHHKHYFWLRPLLLGQKHGEEAAELPGNLWPILRLWAAGCWISVSTQTFWFSSNKLHLFGCNAKSARCRLGPVAARVQPAGWTGLSLSLNEEAVLPQKPEPGVVGMSPVDQEITLKALQTSLDLSGGRDLDALNECAYCYHVCFLICCSLWQMHGQHRLTTL